jgi:hypothetical protein
VGLSEGVVLGEKWEMLEGMAQEERAFPGVGVGD